MLSRALFSIPCLVGILLTSHAAAIDFTWNGGGGDANWTNIDNWDGGAAPAPANTTNLIFGGTTQTANNNDFATNTIFSGISFTNTADGESFTLSGNQITLAGVGARSTAAVAAGMITDSIDLGLRLNNNLQWTLGTNHNVTINGPISQANATSRSVTAAGNAAVLALTNAANSFDGEVATQNAATLSVASIGAAGVPSAAGAGSTIRLGAASSGSAGTLIYTGAGDSTDRTIHLASSISSTASILNDGTGGLVLTGTFSNGATAGNAKTLSLGGSATAENQIQSVLGDDANGGTLAVSLGDASVWTLSGDNTYTGGTSVGDSARINIAHANALGTGALTLNSGCSFDNTSGGVLSLANALVINGNPIFLGSASLTLTADVTLAGGSADRVISLQGSDLTFSGVVSGGKGIIQSSTGSLVLSNTNTFTGNIRSQNGGNISVSSLADSGVACAAGAGSSILLGASGTSTPGNLVYTGGGHSTNRSVELISSGSSFPSISANGSGPVTFSGVFTNAATAGNTKNLRLVGTNADANTIASALGDGAGGGQLAVLKQEVGRWVLTASNTYSGTTTINEGVLQIGDGGTTGTLPTGSTINITADGTLCFNRSDTVIQGTDFTATPIDGGGTFEVKGGGIVRLNQSESFAGGIHLVIESGSTLDLDYVGSETVATLTVGGVQLDSGPHDASTDPGVITGTGSLFVQTGPVSDLPNIISIVRDGGGNVILTLDGPAAGLTVQQSNDLGAGSFSDIPSSAGADTLTIDAADTDPDADGKDFYRVRN